MIQLSDTKKTLDTSTLAKKLAGRSSHTAKESAKSKLGYEVLYRRHDSPIQVPLSFGKKSPPSSTGSALLDSFVNQAIAEPISLQHLYLVNVANQPQKTTSPVRRQPVSPPAEKPSEKPAQSATPKALSDEPPTAAEPNVIGRPVRRPIEKVPAAKISVVAKTPTAKTHVAKTPTVKAHVAKISKAKTPTAKQSVAKQHRPLPSIPADRKQRTSAPAKVTHQKPVLTAPVNSGKSARDSAAAVGLIDINDTLLFGGDHQNLASTDPFISDSNPQNNDTGVLSYLSQQVSAFTVGKLQSGFPNNTDPKVIHRPDPPKHKTVLAIRDFKLSQLDSEDPSAQQNQQTTMNNTRAQNVAANAPEFKALSQQVNALNRQIADLSQKLAQVTQAKAS